MTSGEVTPALYARVDLARYYTGLKTCRNWIVKPTGGVENRPGTRLVSAANDSATVSRLIGFRFSSAQSYALEFGDYSMRVIFQGALLTYDAADHDAWVGEVGYVIDDVRVNAGSVYRCNTSHTASTSFATDLPLYWDLVDGEPVEIITPYPASVLNDLVYTQNADVMTITNQGYKQRQLGRYAHTDWRLSEFVNLNGPFGDQNIDETLTIISDDVEGDVTLTSTLDIFAAEMVGQLIKIEQHPENLVSQWEVSAAIGSNEIRKTDVGYYQAVAAGTTGTVRPDHTIGIAYDGNPGVAWEYLHNGYGIAKITAFTSATEVDATVLSRLPDSVVTGTFPLTIQGMIQGTPYDAGSPPEFPETPAVDVRVTINGHGWVSGDSITISGVTGITGANGTWEIDVVDANTFDLVGCTATGTWGSTGTASKTLTAKATYKWSLGAWGGDQGYPAATTYYQQRQVFGGAPGRPQACQMSRSGAFRDFGTTIPSLDDDSLNFSLVAGTIGHILHFVNLKQLIALTTEGPWTITKEQGNPIPITDPQGEGGAASVRPLKINKQALYVEDKGGAIRSLGYEFSSDSYEGKDLTITADHLFKNKAITDWCYQKIPNRCIWMVRNDGILIGLTYMIEQEVVGWHRHDTDGYVESVCCVSEPTEDVVYMVVRRNINGTDQRFIERIADRSLATPEDAFFVDCGLSYDGRGAGDAITWILTGGTEWSHTEDLTFTTVEDFFTGASDVGDVIQLYDTEGSQIRLKITEYVSAKEVTVMASKTVPAQFRAISQQGFDLARDTFAGIGHLEGKIVAILADGKVAPPVTVSAGVATIPNAAAVVHIGLPIEADIETLEVAVQGQAIQDRLKNINSVSLMVQDTKGILAGPNADNLLQTRTEVGSAYEEIYKETTGIMRVNVISDWNKGGGVMIRQADPLPATILAIIPTVTVSGS